MRPTTYAYARANLAALLAEVARRRDAIVIHRGGRDDVALIAAKELRSLAETVHILRSPANADRLLRALQRAQQRRRGRPDSLDKLRLSLGLDEN